MSNTTNEDPKNMALLFFLDHLMQKSGTRTIHDLSCQFGARGFSPEMREAVGGTQEGLSDFLAQFPSLFKLEDDTVSLTMYNEPGSGVEGGTGPLLTQLAPRDRDYDKEAVVFFEKKLMKFGPEMLVKSLLGHRSQAAPEVRLVSGRHVKDFTDFLATHKEFVVEGDRVRLTNMPEPTQPEADIDTETGLPLAGAKAKLVAVEFLKSTLEEQEGIPIPLESLYQLFCGRFSHMVRQDVAANPKELLQFLKLNRNIFFIRSNKVSLVKNRPEGDGTSPPLQDSESECSDASSVSIAANPLDRITVVKSLKAAQQALQEIANAGVQLMDKPAVSFDFKLVTIGQDFIVLVAVGLWDGRIYLFDCAHSDSILIESGLKDLLESPDWVKVIHDCRKVSAILQNQYGIQLEEVFDTQVANSILTQAKLGKPVEEVKPINFYHLQRLYHPESLLMSDTNPRKMVRQETNGMWSQRPLTDEVIVQACEEAGVLMPFIYNTINKQLKPEMRNLFDQMCDAHIQSLIQKGTESAVKKREPKLRVQNLTNGFSNGLQSESNSNMSEISNTNGEMKKSVSKAVNPAEIGQSRNPEPVFKPEPVREKPKMVDGCTQTLSTGEITMHKVYTERA